MESRLPKPKIVVKKVISAMDNMNAKNNLKAATKGGNNVVPQSKSSTSTKPSTTNENKLPVKPQPLVRAKTLSTITRPNNTAIKRTATTITHGEPKKPFVKPVAKALANRPNNNALASSAANKVLQNDADNKTDKLKRWDLRGRLAQSNDKLTVVQQKNKEITSKNKTLQELADTLKASEAEYKIKAEKLEVSNNTLTSELESMRAEMSMLQKHREDLDKNLKELEELCRNLSQTLEELRQESKTREALLSEKTTQLTAAKAELEVEKDKNKDLSSTVEKLQTLAHKMDNERRVLHNTIQELKGNIRVFCRVRPRTLKEIEQMKL